MQGVMTILIVSILAVATSCVRMPEKYSYVLDRAADTNEELLEKTDDASNTKKLEVYKIIIGEDIKTLRHAAQTIRNGGGE